METIARKSDGRRIFTPEFKRQQIERAVRGEVTLAELSRELQIARPLQQILGHASVVMTQQNAKLSNETVRRETARMAHSIGGTRW